MNHKIHSKEAPDSKEGILDIIYEGLIEKEIENISSIAYDTIFNEAYGFVESEFNFFDDTPKSFEVSLSGDADGSGYTLNNMIAIDGVLDGDFDNSRINKTEEEHREMNKQIESKTEEVFVFISKYFDRIKESFEEREPIEFSIKSKTEYNSEPPKYRVVGISLKGGDDIILSLEKIE